MRFVHGHANRTKTRPPIGPDDYTVEHRGYRTPCWIRRGWINNKGYGMITIAGVRKYAHRAMYEQEIGPLPAGVTLDHLCRNPACMRPSHLEPVTHAENVQRGKGTKITADDVRAIRAAPASVGNPELAERFGLDVSHISRIRTRKRWRNVR